MNVLDLVIALVVPLAFPADATAGWKTFESGWKYATKVSLMDDSVIHIAGKESTTATANHSDPTVNPLLFISCKLGETPDVVLLWRTPIGNGSNDHQVPFKVRFRFDKEQATEKNMFLTSSGDITYLPTKGKDLDKFLKHKTLLTDITSSAGDYLLAQFSLVGLQEAIAPMWDECFKTRSKK